MRPQAVFSALFLLALAAWAQPGGLAEAVREAGRGSQPVWVAWTVPVIEGHGYTCCWSRDWKRSSCRLEEKNQSWGSSDDDPRQDPYLKVLVRLQDGRVDRIRSVSAGCPLDAGSRRLVELEEVKPEESVRYLSGLVNSGVVDEEGLDALALHRNSGALDSLADFATSPRYAMDVREHALFWLGEARGRAGYEVVARVLREDKDDEVREKALFPLSESPVPEAGELLLQTARTDRSSEVRSQALFWLAQKDHPQAPATILEAISKDADSEVREQAVFALSQLPKGKGVPLLIQLGRDSRDREVRKQALFWLAESDDPAAVKFLEKMLEE
jgi:hypothetical protein